MVPRRTVAREIAVEGIALHAGNPVKMRIRPAAGETGIRFCRSDLPERPVITALWSNILDSRFATVIGENGGSVGVTEHLLAAFSAVGVDDCLIELDGPEPPFLDGDALSFLRLLDEAGMRELDIGRREIIIVRRPVTVQSADASVNLLPSTEPEFTFAIDFPGTAIGHQTFECKFNEATFRREIGPARTFGFLDQADALRRSGFARGASLENTLVIDGDRLCNPGKQRFRDEFVRHKILDAVGDMKLAGAPVIARFEGHRSSHALNAAVLRRLFSDPDNYQRIAA